MNYYPAGSAALLDRALGGPECPFPHYDRFGRLDTRPVFTETRCPGCNSYVCEHHQSWSTRNLCAPCELAAPEEEP